MKNTYKIEDGWLAAINGPLEDDRIAALQNLDILDSPSETSFDIISSLAKDKLKTEIAVISLVDIERQWFKSCLGLDAEETPRDQAFCTHAILSDEVLVVKNALKDERFKNNPLVVGGPKIRFYLGAPLIIKPGIRLGTLCVIDSKPRKKVTEEEKQYVQNLAQLVVDEMNLRYSKIKAEKDNASKSDFLANMSHEIRTPINGIIGMATILKKTKLSKKQHLYLNSLESSSDHLLELINNILDLSKIEAGKIKIDNKPFNLKKLCKFCMDSISNKAKNAGISSTIYIEPGINNNFISDSLRIKQVLINLLSNAVKFTSEGSIQLNVTSLKETSKYQTLKIIIQDTGIGLSKHEQERIFNKFEQADSSTTRKYGGTGLGLNISKKLMELLGGTIKLHSEKGVGSTFTLTIKLKKGIESIKSPQTKKSNTKKKHSKNVSKTYSLLLVEDNKINQMVARIMLETAGYKVTIMENGKEAVNYVKKNHNITDLILMDCQMPIMDGYEATKKIKKFLKKEGIHIPIIAMTANAVKGDKEECINFGMDDYISKPVKEKTLLDKIKYYLT